MSFLVEDFAVQPHSSIEVLDSGAIRVRARLARTGIQEYDAWPGAPIQDRKIRLYRPADEVFSDASIASLRSNPITVYHPKDGEVRADTWRKLAVGHVEAYDVKRAVVDGASDGMGEEFIETSIVVSDAEAVKRVQAKELSEFSSGYGMTIDWTPGEYRGEKYDGVQRSIRHNHQALLRAGDARAGRQARILDSNHTEDNEMTFKELQAALDAANAKIKELEAAAPTEGLDALKAELETVKAQLVDSQKQLGEALAKQTPALDANEVDRIVSETLEVRDAVRPMLPKDYNFAGKSVGTLKLDAIKSCKPELAKRLGDSPSEAVVDGAFAALASDKTKYVAPVVKTDSKDEPKSPRQAYLDAVAEANQKALAGAQ